MLLLLRQRLLPRRGLELHPHRVSRLLLLLLLSTLGCVS